MEKILITEMKIKNKDSCFVKNCRSKPEVKLYYVNRQYCKRHFLELIEKRIRKDIRTNNKLDLRKKYLLLNDSSKEFFLARYFLKKIFGDYLKINEVKKHKNQKNLIIPTNLDREINNDFEKFIKNKKIVNNNQIKILSNLLEGEIFLAAKLLNIKHSKKKEGQNYLIEKTEELYPGIKFSLKKSLDFIKNLEK